MDKKPTEDKKSEGSKTTSSPPPKSGKKDEKSHAAAAATGPDSREAAQPIAAEANRPGEKNPAPTTTGGTRASEVPEAIIRRESIVRPVGSNYAVIHHRGCRHSLRFGSHSADSISRFSGPGTIPGDHVLQRSRRPMSPGRHITGPRPNPFEGPRPTGCEHYFPLPLGGARRRYPGRPLREDERKRKRNEQATETQSQEDEGEERPFSRGPAETRHDYCEMPRDYYETHHEYYETHRDYFELSRYYFEMFRSQFESFRSRLETFSNELEMSRNQLETFRRELHTCRGQLESFRSQVERCHGRFETYRNYLETSCGQLETLHDQVNASFDQINTSFSQVNTSFGQVNTSFGQLSASCGRAETFRARTGSRNTARRSRRMGQPLGGDRHCDYQDQHSSNQREDNIGTSQSTPPSIFSYQRNKVDSDSHRDHQYQCSSKRRRDESGNSDKCPLFHRQLEYKAYSDSGSDSGSGSGSGSDHGSDHVHEKEQSSKPLSESESSQYDSPSVLSLDRQNNDDLNLKLSPQQQTSQQCDETATEESNVQAQSPMEESKVLGREKESS